MYSCYSVLEYYNLFSGVRLSTRSFCFIWKAEIFFRKFQSLPEIHPVCPLEIRGQEILAMFFIFGSRVLTK